jgi:hypothetical protein
MKLTHFHFDADIAFLLDEEEAKKKIFVLSDDGKKVFPSFWHFFSFFFWLMENER